MSYIRLISFYVDRCLILFGGGIIALFGAHLVHYDGAGGLAVITMAFVAGMKWRKEGWQKENPVFQIFQKIWIIFEPNRGDGGLVYNA